MLSKSSSFEARLNIAFKSIEARLNIAFKSIGIGGLIISLFTESRSSRIIVPVSVSVFLIDAILIRALMREACAGKTISKCKSCLQKENQSQGGSLLSNILGHGLMNQKQSKTLAKRNKCRIPCYPLPTNTYSQHLDHRRYSLHQLSIPLPDQHQPRCHIQRLLPFRHDPQAQLAWDYRFRPM